MCNPSTGCKSTPDFLVRDTDDLCYQAVPFFFSTLPPSVTPKPGAGDKQGIVALDEGTINTLIIVGVIVGVVIIAAIAAIVILKQRKKTTKEPINRQSRARPVANQSHPQEYTNAGATLDAYKIPAGGSGSNSMKWRQSSAGDGLPERGQLPVNEEQSWNYETTAEQL